MIALQAARIIPAGDLFGNAAAPLMRVRLDRAVDREHRCCNNIAVIGPGKAQHAGELRCEDCGRHRGWIPREALDFLTNGSQRFGAPADPLTLRDKKIGDHVMADDKQYDNSGILFRNDDKSKETDGDYRGDCTIAGVEYWMSGWIKQGKKGKFLSFAFKPKEPKQAAKPEFNDEIGF